MASPDTHLSFFLAQAQPQPTSDQMLSGAAGTAATGAPAGSPPAGATPPASGPGTFSLLPLLLIAMAALIIPSMLSGRREKKKRETLMAAMGKGDKVLTIAGQIGWVDQIKDNEVVLRLDENSNFKGRFTKAAIQQILESRSSGGSSPEIADAPSIEVKAKSEKSATAR